MPDLTDIVNRLPLIGRPQPSQAPPWPGGPPMPQAGGPQAAPVQKSYPPAPAVRNQSKPTQMAMTDLKYNALNVDRLNVSVVARGGFNSVTPDMVIWNYYEYQVKDLDANAEENELSRFADWSLQELGVKDLKLDFHPGGKATITGKIPFMGLPIPFQAEISSEITSNKQVLLTIDSFSAGFKMPGKIRDLFIDLILSEGDPPTEMPDKPTEVFSLRDAMKKVNSNQILLDFTRMKAPVDLPITLFETTEQGLRVAGGLERMAKPAPPTAPALPTLPKLNGLKRP